MSTWPNRGASGGPCGGLIERKSEQPKPVRPRRSDSSQQASSKPGAVHSPSSLASFIVSLASYTPASERNDRK